MDRYEHQSLHSPLVVVRSPASDLVICSDIPTTFLLENSCKLNHNSKQSMFHHDVVRDVTMDSDAMPNMGEENEATNETMLQQNSNDENDNNDVVSLSEINETEEIHMDRPPLREATSADINDPMDIDCIVTKNGNAREEEKNGTTNTASQTTFVGHSILHGSDLTNLKAPIDNDKSESPVNPGPVSPDNANNEKPSTLETAVHDIGTNDTEPKTTVAKNDDNSADDENGLDTMVFQTGPDVVDLTMDSSSKSSAESGPSNGADHFAKPMTAGKDDTDENVSLDRRMNESGLIETNLPETAFSQSQQTTNTDTIKVPVASDANQTGLIESLPATTNFPDGIRVPVKEFTISPRTHEVRSQAVSTSTLMKTTRNDDKISSNWKHHSSSFSETASAYEGSEASVPSKTPERSFVCSVTEFVGHTPQRESYLDQSNFRETLSQTTAASVLANRKVKSLELKKRKRFVSNIDFDPAAWQQADGKLIVNAEFTKTRRTERAGGQAYVPNVEPLELGKDNNMEIWEPRLITTAQESQKEKPPSRSRTRAKAAAKSTASRVGDKYQATILDHPSTYNRANDDSDYLGGSVLWDPIQAEAARKRGEQIDEFLENKNLELNVKYLLMESLHCSSYDVKKAMRTFINMYQKRQKFLTEFSDTEQKRFVDSIAPNLLGTKKDFKAAAAAMDRTKETLMVHYYKWKSKQKEYLRIKRDRHKEPDYCEVCDDGGSLIVCELCRKAWHLKCLLPPLTKVPEGDWYCKRCIYSSPARLRRLAGSATIDTSSHAEDKKPNAIKPENSLTNTQRKKTLFATQHSEKSRLHDLRAIHKELNGSSSKSPKKPVATPIAVNKPQNLASSASLLSAVPSGMVWDNRNRVWVPCDPNAKKPQSPTKNPPEQAGSSKAVLVASPSDKSNPSEMGKISPQPLDVDDFSPSSSEKSILSNGTRASSDSSFHADPENDDEDVDDDEYEQEETQQPKKPLKAKASLLGRPQNSQNISGMEKTTVTYYDVHVPFSPEGLLVNISSHPSGLGVCFTGYRKDTNGKQGPAEQRQLFRSIGDRFVSVDGVDCRGLSFNEVRNLLKSRWPGQAAKYLRMAQDVITRAQNATTSNRIQSLSTNQQHKADVISSQASGSTNAVNTSATIPSGQTIIAPNDGQTGATIPSAQLNIAPRDVTSSTMHAQSNANAVPVTVEAATISAILAQPIAHQPSALVQQLRPLGQPPVPSHAPIIQPRFSTQGMQYPQYQPTPIAPFIPNQEVTDLKDALESMRMPELTVFLNRHNIYTANNFLNSNSTFLASAWARERRITWDVALDFMGAARLQVRQYLVAKNATNNVR